MTCDGHFKNSEFSREMPGSDGGGVAAVFRLGFRKTISLVFATFSLRLFDNIRDLSHERIL